MNTLKVGTLLIVLTALSVYLGNLLGGIVGAAAALLIASLMNLGTYWYSDRIILRIMHAKPMNKDKYPTLHNIIRTLAQRANIPSPKLYIVPSPSPNAFATGRNPEHGIIVINQGLMNLLNPNEIEGVIAHEIAHIKHRDTLTSAIVATIAGAIMVLADIARFSMLFHTNDDEEGNSLVFLIGLVVAPISALCIQMAISRTREFEADRTGACLAGSGLGLASALLKLERAIGILPNHMPPTAAHLCIVNPMKRKGSALFNLFRTHPSTWQRVKKLYQVHEQINKEILVSSLIS